MTQGAGPRVPPAGARRRRARRATPWREKRMDEKKKDFAVSYAIESTMTGRGPAPRMNVEMPDRAISLPTAVFVVTHSAYASQGPENPLQGTASAHEITFGVVCHADEARTIALLAQEYNLSSPSRSYSSVRFWMLADLQLASSGKGVGHSLI